MNALQPLKVSRDYIFPGRFDEQLIALGNFNAALRTELGIEEEPEKI